MTRLGLQGALLLSSVAFGCETTPAPPPPPAQSASAAPLYVPPAPEGCARAGSLDGIEADPACIVARADDGAMREAMKHLTFELKADAPAIVAGGTMVLRLTIANGGGSEVAVQLDAQPLGTGMRPDWSRLAGVPEPKPAMSGAPPSDVYRLLMPVRTLDARDKSVDGLPTTGTALPVTTTRFLRVRLKPGGKLTQNFTWWALRIPTPAPITRDDAGHRFVPKTAPVPLPPGEYSINVELPLHGISASESSVATRVLVERPDSGP